MWPTMPVPPSLLLPLLLCLFTPKSAIADRRAMFDQNGEFLPHVRLAKDLVEKYDNRVRPVLQHSKPTQVNFTMSLYQILAINEKVQSVDLNLWVIQKWHDEFLGWDPNKYGGINDTILPHQKIWLPDTYLYNSMVMNREETERYINVVVSTEYWQRGRGAQVMFMYPALYRVSCRINILYFPYDQQNCTLVISSWTSDMTSIDYQPDANSVNLHSFIRNEEWEVVSFEIRRVVQKFVCCPEPWVLLHASLVVRRKPLYYIVNLVLPTSVITLVAVTGFFTPASTSNERREKLSLGIDSLLAMSILMMMVSEQMPTTSDYLPLFGIFYLSIIMIIFAGTLITAFVLNVHLQKIYNKPIPPLVTYIFFHKMAPWFGVRPSTVLLELWQETGVYIRGLSDKLERRRKKSSDRRRSAMRGSSAKRRQQQRAEKSTDQQQQNNSSPMLRTNSAGLFPHQQNSQKSNLSLRRGHSKRVRQSIMRLSPSMDDLKDRSIEEEREDLGVAGELNARSGLTLGQSIMARQNWRRIAQRASAKHRETVERAMATLAVSDGGQIPLDEIPFADFSPGRLSMVGVGQQQQQNFESIGSPPWLSPRLLPPPPPPPPTHKDHLPPAQSAPPSKCPPPVPSKGASPGLQGNNNSASMPPALQLLLLPQSSQKDPKVNAASVLDLKLRRRFAYEWEFLATVLDRLLLIIFTGLVFLVTGAMIICGEIILRSYPNSPEEAWADELAARGAE